MHYIVPPHDVLAFQIHGFSPFRSLPKPDVSKQLDLLASISFFIVIYILFHKTIQNRPKKFKMEIIVLATTLFLRIQLKDIIPKKHLECHT